MHGAWIWSLVLELDPLFFMLKLKILHPIMKSWHGLPHKKKIRCWSLELGNGYCICSHSGVSSSLTSSWTVACQAPLSMGFPRQEYWSGLPFPSPGDIPDSGIEPASLVSPELQVDSLPLSHLGTYYPGYFIFYWSIVFFFLQCCVNFCHAAYIQLYMHSFSWWFITGYGV